MSNISDNIYDTVASYTSGDYTIDEIDHIPNLEELQHGNKGKKLKVCVLYFDLRNSTELVTSKHKQTVAKVHKGFLYAGAKTIDHFGGQIRSFNGDSILAFWPANYKNEISNCVRAAMGIKWILTEKCKSLFSPYWALDFGIGVDWGDMLVVRSGVPRVSTNNDLVFIGKCVNYAAAIGDQANGPYHVEISPSVYDNLEDGCKYATSNGVRENMWRDGVIEFRGERQSTKLTSYYWSF